MPTIAVAGFQHETNTFAPTKASFAHFEHGGGFPPLTRGAGIFPITEGINIPLSGSIAELQALGHRVIPIIWANASPSAHVTQEAYERIAGWLLEDLAKVLPVDAVYLDLHGAMVCEHLDDGEGELLARVRKLVGPRIPIVTSLDLHANVTPAMIAQSDGMVAYRTYPHIDMSDTGRRAARLLDSILKSGDRPAKSFNQLDFLIPLTAQCSLIDPVKGLYTRMGALETETGLSLSFTPCFPAADFIHCRPAVFGYGKEPALVKRMVDRFATEIADSEKLFDTSFLTPDEGVQRAMARSTPGGPPVVLADTQDNPGAGGNGDTVGMLDALIRNRAEDAALAILVDAEAAKLAHQAGVGAELEFSLGAKSGIPGHVPHVGRFRVERLGDGFFTCTGPFYKGGKMRLGPMAQLRHGGVRVVIASRKVQAADQEMFRCVGVEPRTQRILVLKSSVHFRADFQPIAREVLVVAAPGPNAADTAKLPWKRLQPGLRLRPMGPAFGA